jgi:hypothetical protein
VELPQQQQREGVLLPQQVEDNMSSTQLIEGFSLQSLLHDMPAVHQPQGRQQVRVGRALADAV